ncbi:MULTISPECIES: Asp23/Gls24 family envelope stress response protein [Clostridia]|uniref:Asp23/Gls24 family envelope stress response protein n=1 Tax=Faecalicatena fissicatena TaxID=290055 RepID=A0ABS2E4Y1_9FIRM|nr:MULTISPECIES: Asp23/Gls24 family envelope stress response protein [Clostridia]HIX99948.1 Asp23/Gls24 family envelope stress response protein [Candidatus Dorea intestinigallinarum]HJA43024.1 Asp23/Gls24 family envelope stress response protein [Candidatus Dorea stercoravium]MBM6684186.1 Asp23/Gls24 family envelope stress response protein [Faecalicatena contorta]MBM6709502.1 Asp23/Gls24 family envelope stress response protein [Faecalicatena contorta]MBM6736691.1 Asp23/Gls24 family envelope str
MKGSMSTDLGIITVNPEVIAKYAGTVAVECFGIVGMAAVNMKDGLVRLLKKDSLTHGIQVTISDDNRITIDFHVIVSYGVSISAVTDNLISNVKYRVEEFSGMPVDKINIYIEGVRVID